MNQDKLMLEELHRLEFVVPLNLVEVREEADDQVAVVYEFGVRVFPMFGKPGKRFQMEIRCPRGLLARPTELRALVDQAASGDLAEALTVFMAHMRGDLVEKATPTKPRDVAGVVRELLAEVDQALEPLRWFFGMLDRRARRAVSR